MKHQKDSTEKYFLNISKFSSYKIKKTSIKVLSLRSHKIFEFNDILLLNFV